MFKAFLINISRPKLSRFYVNLFQDETIKESIKTYNNKRPYLNLNIKTPNL
jgi:hypothetical protein